MAQPEARERLCIRRGESGRQLGQVDETQRAIDESGTRARANQANQNSLLMCVTKLSMTCGVRITNEAAGGHHISYHLQ